MIGIGKGNLKIIIIIIVTTTIIIFFFFFGDRVSLCSLGWRQQMVTPLHQPPEHWRYRHVPQTWLYQAICPFSDPLGPLCVWVDTLWHICIELVDTFLKKKKKNKQASFSSKTLKQPQRQSLSWVDLCLNLGWTKFELCVCVGNRKGLVYKDTLAGFFPFAFPSQDLTDFSSIFCPGDRHVCVGESYPRGPRWVNEQQQGFLLLKKKGCRSWKGLGYACRVQKLQKMTEDLRKLFLSGCLLWESCQGKLVSGPL